MRYLLIALLILAAPTAARSSDWTTADTAMQATYAVIHIADWAQTRYIIRNPETRSERNVILGTYPHRDSVNAYFASTLLLHTAVSYMLPDPYRSIWQTVWIGVEAATVVRNYNVGVRVSW